MQRILSLVTLASIGAMGWMFLRGGGLNQIAVPGRQNQQPPAQHNYQTPGPWMSAQPQQDLRQSPYRSASTGGEANNVQTEPMGGPSIRIASYNIQVFGNAKASKPYVMNTLAQIIRLFDVVAIQEIRTKDNYLIPNFVQLINQGGHRYDHVVGPRLGYTTVKEQYAFIYNTDRIELDRQSVYRVRDPDELLHREPLVATFRTRGVDPAEAFTFTLVNIHTDPDEVSEELDALAEVYRVVRRAGRDEDDVIVLGDLNTDDRRLGRLGQIPGMYPLIAGVWTNTKQSKQYDNILIHQPSTVEYTGRSGVLDVMRIMNLNERQAMQVSDHFPVWGEFSIYERDRFGRIANRRLMQNR